MDIDEGEEFGMDAARKWCVHNNCARPVEYVTEGVAFVMRGLIHVSSPGSAELFFCAFHAPKSTAQLVGDGS